jgi:hypothetical protein
MGTQEFTSNEATLTRGKSSHKDCTVKIYARGNPVLQGRIAKTKGARITGVRTKMKHPV